MGLRTIAIVSPGDMGSNVGRVLRAHGYDVITSLEGRSPRTRGLAAAAGLRDVGALDEMVRQADLLLSIIPPSNALPLARQVAGALRATGATPYVVDCNAISPQTVAQVEQAITPAGGRFIDAGIVGGPPDSTGPGPCFYVSGPHAAAMEELDGKGIVVRTLGHRVGDASALKMCYAALTKGTYALHIAVLTAAESLGLSPQLIAELRRSQGDVLRQMEARIPPLSAKVYRWVAEMEAIAATFQHAGITPLLHQGAAEVYRLFNSTPLAQETPETIDATRTLQQTIRAIADALPHRTAT